MYLLGVLTFDPHSDIYCGTDNLPLKRCVICISETQASITIIVTFIERQHIR